MKTEDTSSESNDSPTRQDMVDSTREIVERVDSQTEAVRADLADRTETVREQVVDSTQTAKAALADKTEATRAELETKYDTRKAAVDSRFINYRTWFIFAVIAISLTNTVLYYLFLNPRTPSSLLVIGEVKALGPTDLCPGQYLDYSFDMEVEEAGVYGLDQSVFRTSPPPTIALFSESQFFVIGSPRVLIVTRHWQIPKSYEDENTKEVVEFSAGNYERNLAVGTTWRSTKPSTRTINFSIREGCKS